MLPTAALRRATRLRLILSAAILLLMLASGWVLPAAAQDGIPVIPPATPQPDLLLDVDWYRQSLINSADAWNGGLNGDSGMGAYGDDFGGFFHVNLDRQFRQTPMRLTTSVAQSRAIYMNVEAYRAAGADAGQRFLDAAVKGADFLLANFRDPDYGGFYWEVSPGGQVVTDMKQGYGNVHPMLALAHVYAISHDPAYLDAALEQLDVIRQYFFDPDYPGGILPGFSRDFSRVEGVKNIDTFTHFFEVLLALYDVTDGEQQAEIADQIAFHGAYLTEHLYHDQDGFTDRGYVAYNYDEAWQPSQMPYSRATQWSGALQASTGHNIELAYLLSRAVERGFNPDWLFVADKLLRFCTEYAIDPTYGGMIYEVTDYDGQPLPGNPDNDLFVWWAQAETARALLHFTIVRGEDHAADFSRVQSLFNQHQTDLDYGGVYASLSLARGLAPVSTYKGDVWKANYHYSMFFTEVLRLAETYPDQMAALSQTAPQGA